MKTAATLALGLLAALLAACAPRPQEINLSAQAMQYSPTTIEVTAGRPVRLTFVNDDGVEHDFSIMEFPMAAMGATQEPVAGHDMGHMAEEPELHLAAMMGQNATIEFTPSKPGSYEFFCTVTGHKEAGMRGTLVVKAP